MELMLWYNLMFDDVDCEVILVIYVVVGWDWCMLFVELCMLYQYFGYFLLVECDGCLVGLLCVEEEILICVWLVEIVVLFGVQSSGVGVVLLWCFVEDYCGVYLFIDVIFGIEVFFCCYGIYIQQVLEKILCDQSGMQSCLEILFIVFWVCVSMCLFFSVSIWQML